MNPSFRALLNDLKYRLCLGICRVYISAQGIFTTERKWSSNIRGGNNASMLRGSIMSGLDGRRDFESNSLIGTFPFNWEVTNEQSLCN